MSELTLTLYRLHLYDGQYLIDRVNRFSEEDVDSEEIATCSSRNAAMAIFRLCGVSHYHDWTEEYHRSHWGMPLSEVE